MIALYVIFTLPFTVWVLTTFMRDLPVEIEEAAIVDGATPWIIITKVFLPLLWPALVTTGASGLHRAWNEFLFALTFTCPNDPDGAGGHRASVRRASRKSPGGRSWRPRSSSPCR
jgi:trehalose/maltose transport system permease protein